MLHGPVAADVLIYLDGDRFRLVVSRGDLEDHLAGAPVDLLVVGLLAFGHDVKGVADVKVKRLIFGRVVDTVFADELEPALRVRL